MSSAIMKLTGYMPFGVVRAMSDVNPLIVNYHMVSDKVLPYVSHLYRYRNVRDFINDVDFLKKRYKPLSMTDFLDYRKNSRPVPSNSVMMTFDDGFSEIYEVVAPLLYERNFPATFFLTKNFIDNVELNYDNKKSLIIDRLKISKDNKKQEKISRMLGVEGKRDISKDILTLPVARRPLVDELALELGIDIAEFLKEKKPYITSSRVWEMRNIGFAFGGHSVDHPNYAEITLNEQIFQTIESTDHIANTFNLDYRVFAFPYSDLKIRQQFFRTIEGKVNASFGTQGLFDDSAE